MTKSKEHTYAFAYGQLAERVEHALADIRYIRKGPRATLNCILIELKELETRLCQQKQEIERGRKEDHRSRLPDCVEAQALG